MAGHKDHGPPCTEYNEAAACPVSSIFNLALFYAALARNKARALELLAEALRPSLTEWSKQDPDFASLRDDPAYQALYTG